MVKTLVLLCFLTFASLLKADETALTCGKTDVDNAITAASDEEIVHVPAGSCTWTSALNTITGKDIDLRGAGIGHTIITLTGSAGIGGDGVKIGVTSSKVSGFTFIISGNSTDAPVHTIGGQNFRVHHNRFVNSSINGSRHAFYASASLGGGIPHPTGLVDHNQGYNVRVLVQSNSGDDFGYQEWDDASTIGKADQTGVVYFEDNDFRRDNNNADVADCNYGGRFVFRYNYVENGIVDAHGITQEHGRACRSWEIYRNTAHCTNGSLPGCFAFAWPRGGTGVIYENRVTGPYTYHTAFDNRRSFDATISAYPPSECDGGSDWDKNTTVGWPCRDQIGRGKDASTWVPDTPPFPDQDSEPTYVWNNSKAGVVSGATVINCGNDVKTNGSCADIVVDRDFFNTNRSGYTAYQYPHPLNTDAATTPVRSRIRLFPR